ncbi:MAG: oligosaccharide flippase family protein [Alistipes sp.]|nr:oligosaccharide flippase family protein [Alistipes sp.]
MKTNTILKGTLILTCAGIVTRLLGFYYRIFLTNAIGAEGLGLYQMVFPLSSICLAISSSGISIAISRYTAAFLSSGEKKRSKDSLIVGMCLSLILAAASASILFFASGPIAVYIFNDERCTLLIRILALSIPLAVIHGSVASYYMGKSNAAVPAIAQLLEQVVRVGSVLLIFTIRESQGLTVSAATGMAGLLCGEAASCLFSLTVCSLTANDFHIKNPLDLTGKMLHMAVPLSLNRVILSLIHSMEAVLVPAMLRQNGASVSESLSTYGILSGMAFPLIMLPSTLINSFSAMLLPAVSGANSDRHAASVRKTISTAYEYSMLIGIFCLGAFLIWGNQAGTLLFGVPEVGIYVTAFAWICPFLYISTTLASILNGLGKTKQTLFLDVSCHLLKILLIVLLIPRMGITGFLIAFLISEILLALLSAAFLNNLYSASFDVFQFVVKPVFSLAVSAGVALYFNHIFSESVLADIPILFLLLCGSVMGTVYCFFMFVVFKKRRTAVNILN